MDYEKLTLNTDEFMTIPIYLSVPCHSRKVLVGNPLNPFNDGFPLTACGNDMT